MDPSTLLTLSACLLVALCLILVPMAPGGVVDTRDFSALPRWQYRLFNVFLVSLGLASLTTATFAVLGTEVFFAAVVIGLLYVLVFALDLAKVFPVVEDPLPPQLLVLEVLDLALGGVLVVVAVEGLLG